ncbi:nucleotide-diphospho-sugar transferase [Tanacetum coccineum]
MEASRVCQADKHDKEHKALVPRILTDEKSMRNRGRLRDRGVRWREVSKRRIFNWNKKNTSSGTGVSVDSDDTMNDVTQVGITSAVQEGVTPSVVDMTVDMGKHNSSGDTTVPESFSPLSTPVNTAGNALGKSSYANITSKPSGMKVKVHTLFTLGGNGIDVVVLGKYGLVRSMFSSSTGLFSFQFSSMDGLDAMLKNGLWVIQNNPLILKKWHPDENLLKEDVSTVPVWVKLHGVPVTAFSENGLSAIATKLELKDNIVVAMPKITREGHYTCNVRVEYEWKPLRCSSCKVFRHIHKECPKNTCAGEKKTVKKPCQASQGIPIGLKMAFKSQKEYRPVTKKPNTSSSGNKKKGVDPTIEVSNSNPFDVLYSVDNDVEFGTNKGLKIDEIERQIGEGKLRLLDNDGNPLVPTGIVESNSEVDVRDSYPDNDDYDPYDDDMYENHDLSEHLQSICDDLDITVRDRKKK